MHSDVKIRDLPSLCSAFGFPHDAVAQDELISVFFEETITKLQKPFDYGQQNLQLAQIVSDTEGQNLTEGM